MRRFGKRRERKLFPVNQWKAIGSKVEVLEAATITSAHASTINCTEVAGRCRMTRLYNPSENRSS